MCEHVKDIQTPPPIFTGPKGLSQEAQLSSWVRQLAFLQVTEGVWDSKLVKRCDLSGKLMTNGLSYYALDLAFVTMKSDLTCKAYFRIGPTIDGRKI